MNIISSGSPIAVVERDTGIGKDTLRVWERRYGFPTPVRDEAGDRLYPLDQVERLRLIRRLMDLGHRPGRLVGADAKDLEQLALRAGLGSGTPGGGGDAPDALSAEGDHDVRRQAAAVIRSLVAHDVDGVRDRLSTAMMRGGLQRFVLDAVPAMNEAVGDAWGRGELQVFEEHLYTELLQMQLRQAITSLPSGDGSPRILLTTVPEEQHALGILMLEALFRLHGAVCISLGTQTPIADTVAAARAHRAEVVVLSFSAAFPQRQIAPILRQLRAALPEQVEIWAGGSGVRKLAAARNTGLENTRFGASLVEALGFLSEWPRG